MRKSRLKISHCVFIYSVSEHFIRTLDNFQRHVKIGWRKSQQYFVGNEMEICRTHSQLIRIKYVMCFEDISLARITNFALESLNVDYAESTLPPPPHTHPHPRTHSIKHVYFNRVIGMTKLSHWINCKTNINEASHFGLLLEDKHFCKYLCHLERKLFTQIDSQPLMNDNFRTLNSCCNLKVWMFFYNSFYCTWNLV